MGRQNRAETGHSMGAGGWPRRIRAFLAWLGGRETLPPPAPAVSPPEGSMPRGRGRLAWILESDSLPAAELDSGPAKGPGLLRWLLAPERLPAAEPGPSSSSESFAAWVIGSERLPTAGYPEPEGGPE